MKATRLIQTLLFLASMLLESESAKILFFHTLAGHSHQVVTWPLADALASRGHEVTYITPNDPSRFQTTNNISFVVPKQLTAYIEKIIGDDFDVQLRVENRLPGLIDIAFDTGYDSCEALYTSPEFKTWLARNPKIDLVLIDNCYQLECGAALAYTLGATFISYGTIAPTGLDYDILGYVPESWAIPQWDVKLAQVPMHFFDRVYNALQSLRWTFWHSFYLPRLDHFIRNELKMPQMPYVGDLVRNVSLVFMTDDVISDYPRSVPPNHVNIACIHCKESTKSLPKEIESFVTSNVTGGKDNDGFVYISLGSIIVASHLPENILKVFFKTIESFPNLKFLWKWNGDFPKKIPDNLYLAKWFPQIDILGHSKIRAFVTQNGRPSTLEALFLGVPMISFPCIGDQDAIASRLSQTGAGIKLELASVTVKELQDAIDTQAYSPIVKARMARYKKILQDQPMTSLEKAVWWTEYVLRTEDTAHLRPAGFHQNWAVRRLIDVWSVLSVGLFVTCSSIFYVLAKIIRKIFKTDNKEKQN